MPDVVEIDPRHRFPYAASRPEPDTARPFSSNTIMCLGSMKTSIVSSGSNTRTPCASITQRTSAKSMWTKLSDPVISVTETFAVTATAEAFCRVRERWWG